MYLYNNIIDIIKEYQLTETLVLQFIVFLESVLSKHEFLISLILKGAVDEEPVISAVRNIAITN